MSRGPTPLDIELLRATATLKIGHESHRTVNDLRGKRRRGSGNACAAGITSVARALIYFAVAAMPHPALRRRFHATHQDVASRAALLPRNSGVTQVFFLAAHSARLLQNRCRRPSLVYLSLVAGIHRRRSKTGSATRSSRMRTAIVCLIGIDAVVSSADKSVTAIVGWASRCKSGCEAGTERQTARTNKSSGELPVEHRGGRYVGNWGRNGDLCRPRCV